jgi:hypothetical protein
MKKREENFKTLTLNEINNRFKTLFLYLSFDEYKFLNTYKNEIRTILNSCNLFD